MIEVRPQATGRPLVSVVIPCFNQARFLQESVESALAQTHRPIEVIVIDDGSTDKIADVVMGFESIRYVRQVNQGLPAARNRGLEEAKGEFIIFLDADDRLLPTAVEKGLRAIGDAPTCAFAFGHYRSITERGQVFIEAPPEDLGDDAYCTLLRRNLVGTTAAALFRTSRLRGVGGFDCSPRFWGCEDYALYLRLAREFAVSRYPDIVAEYRIHSASMSRNAVRMLASVVATLNAQRPSLGRDGRRRSHWRQGLKGYREYYARRIVIDLVAERRRIGWRETVRRLALTACAAPVELVRIGPTVRRSRPATFVVGDVPLAMSSPNGPARYHVARLYPASTAPRHDFNVQPCGLSAFTLECKGPSKDSVVVFGDTPLWTTYGGPTLLTALVPPELYERPGQALVYFIRLR